MPQLHFNLINVNEYRARIAAHDGTGWHHGVYIVRRTPELQRKDPFHAWQAETPEGFLIANQDHLVGAMRACERDIPSYVTHANADSASVRTDPDQIVEVL